MKTAQLLNYAIDRWTPGEGGRTSLQIDSLELGRPYYWRARAEDGANNSTYATAQFEMLPRPVLNAPGVVSPANNEVVSSSRPTLRLANSSFYGLQFKVTSIQQASASRYAIR